MARPTMSFTGHTDEDSEETHLKPRFLLSNDNSNSGSGRSHARPRFLLPNYNSDASTRDTLSIKLRSTNAASTGSTPLSTYTPDEAVTKFQEHLTSLEHRSAPVTLYNGETVADTVAHTCVDAVAHKHGNTITYVCDGKREKIARPIDEIVHIMDPRSGPVAVTAMQRLHLAEDDALNNRLFSDRFNALFPQNTVHVYSANMCFTDKSGPDDFPVSHIVMDDVVGMSMYDWLRRADAGRLSNPAVIASVVAQAAYVLLVLNESGWIHNDALTRNFIVTESAFPEAVLHGARGGLELHIPDGMPRAVLIDYSYSIDCRLGQLAPVESHRLVRSVQSAHPDLFKRAFGLTDVDVKMLDTELIKLPEFLGTFPMTRETAALLATVVGRTPEPLALLFARATMRGGRRLSRRRVGARRTTQRRMTRLRATRLRTTRLRTQNRNRSRRRNHVK